MLDSTAVVVRPLRASDKTEWARMWTAYLAFYETARPQEIFDLYFDRLLGDDPQDYNGLVADIDGKLVGFTHYLYHRHGWSDENVCYLQDLFADPSVRGQGVGRALIEAVYASADADGAPGVYWLTQDFNKTARHLYDRIGKQTPFIKYTRS
ncbi:GNAT family N-acetyltransferase [Roseobacter sp.]|uniref:GNAT family N-acetyltransferase n=1 Tax=Roseobacter sp. TaxID=1907202 RepID=UPI00385E14AB